MVLAALLGQWRTNVKAELSMNLITVALEEDERPHFFCMNEMNGEASSRSGGTAPDH